MRSAARYFNCFLIKDPKTGWLISTPSNSPEHAGLVAGPTMDHQIIRDLFKNCIRAGAILKTDDKLIDSLKEKVKKIAPNQIGKYGQLQEWLQDIDDTSDHYRHVSHLWGVFPGTDITWKTPKLMKAARQSLLYRGDEGTGWSLAWKINLWDRFKEGNHAYKLLKEILSPAEMTGRKGRGGSYNNLFDAHPPFQIDGNFGGATGVAHMLIQSETGPIELLPVLPEALSKGNVKGICARGAFVLDFNWSDGKLQHVQVLSKAGKKCTLKYGKKKITFDTQKGGTYQLNGNLEML
jgi:alpha-L-fucosidase 2